MFSKELDGAKVICHTEWGAYEALYWSTGAFYDRVYYYAICAYPGDRGYDLFGCNDRFEVVSDSPWDSAEECRRIAQNQCGRVLRWVDAGK